MAKDNTAKAATPQAPPKLLSLPPIAVENVLRSASFSGAIAACSCRALRDAWRELTSNHPEFAATALVDRFKTVDAAVEHLYKPEPALLRNPLVKANIAAPAPGLLDPIFSPIHSILPVLLKKRTPKQILGYMTATAASDAHALALLRHLWALREGTDRKSDPTADSQANNNGGGGNANHDGSVAGQAEAAARAANRFLHSASAGAAFAGHEATVVELLRLGADPVTHVLLGAMRAGNARLCAAVLEGDRMAAAASAWSAAAGGDVRSIRGNPSGFVDSYAGSGLASRRMVYIFLWLLPLAYIDAPLGLGGGKGGARGSSGGGGGGGGGGSSSGGSSSVGGQGGASGGCARGMSARALLQLAVDGWCGGGAGSVQPAEDVAAALAAARAAAQKAADTALGDSNPLLPLFVESSTAAAAAAAAAATAAALAALTPPEVPCGGGSSSGGSNSSGSSGSGGGGSRANTSAGPACAFLSSTANHAAVRQLLLQWRPAEWQAPPPRIRAAALPYAASVGAWPVVSELLRAGVDPRDGGAPTTLLYLALVQGRGAMAAWLLVRLLEHPAGVWKGIVGALFAALVTWIMGRASPMQLLLRDEPMPEFEEVLRSLGFTQMNFLFYSYIPLLFLPPRVVVLVSLYGMWTAFKRLRGV